MKDKKSIVYIVIFALSIFVAFMIPVAVFKYEDRRTINYDIHYAAEGMNLNSSSIDISEKLLDFSSELTDFSYLYMDDNEKVPTIQNPKEVKAMAVFDFIEVFLGSEYENYLAGIVGRSDVQDGLLDYLVNGAEDYVTPMFMIRADKKDMFLVWEIDINDDRIGNLELFLDDDTGKLLSIRMEDNYVNDELFRNLVDSDAFMDRIAGYYDLKVSEITNILDSSIVKSRITMQSVILDNDFTVNFVLDGNGDKSIYFNSVDETSLIYDINDGSDEGLIDNSSDDVKENSINSSEDGAEPELDD